MEGRLEPLPDDVEALKAALIVARAEAAAARAQQSDDQALIAHLKLQIEKLNRDRYGPRSERTARLLPPKWRRPKPRRWRRLRASGRPASRSRIICPANA